MRARPVLFACLALALALAGCGRRGALELPPGSPPEKPKPAPTAPAPTTGNPPGGLFRNTSLKTEDPAQAPEAEKNVGATPFVLDPLL